MSSEEFAAKMTVAVALAKERYNHWRTEELLSEGEGIAELS